MAMNNPMQRKANNYLLIGILGTLLVTGSLIGILFLQLNKLNTQIKEEEATMKNVYVVSKEIKSGENVKTDDLKKILVTGQAVPNNAISESNITGETIAKIDLKVGMVVTENMLSEKSEETNADLRTQEYNMILLPTQLEEGNYIDIRLRLPNGTDYIVVSKKKVEIPQIDGVESVNTIKINVSEDEILLMSNAIVEAYWSEGSKLYATIYVEPGMQEQATPTYLPSESVYNAIAIDPNIVSTAKSALAERYNASTSGVSHREIIRNHINSTYNEDSADSIIQGVQDEITRAREERQAYLDALGGN